MFIGVSNPAVMLFLYRVVGRIRVGIAPLPELLDEFLALLIGLQLQERFSLVRANDVSNVFVQPLLIGSCQLLHQLPVACFLLFRILLGGWLWTILVLSSCADGYEHTTAQNNQQQQAIPAAFAHTSPLLRDRNFSA